MNDLKIREMQASDRSSIIKILEGTEAFTELDIPVAVELIDCCLENGAASGYYFRVAELQGQAVGYICYGPTPLTSGTWDAYWLATAADLKGRGIGSALLKTAEENIKAQGGRLLLIETASNPLYLEARRFYKSHGYIIVSSIPDFYSPGDNRIIFRKLL